MSLLERAPGASPDRVGVEGRTSMAVRMRSDELQTRRFEFFAPSHISWPVVDDKARPCGALSRCCAVVSAVDAPVPASHTGMSTILRQRVVFVSGKTVCMYRCCLCRS